ncbi:MAG: ABC transporter permease [Actinomycetota bacterium]
MSSAAITWGLASRSLKLIPRVPSTFIPSLIMPVFFTVAFAGPFAALVNLPGFPADDIIDWVLPFTALQGCAFAGVTTGLGVARDLGNGFYDRFLLSPSSRVALLGGPLLAAVLRALFPLTLMLIIGVIAGAHFREGVAGIVMLTIASLGLALASGAWALGLALRFKTMQIAPLIQIGIFLSMFLSTAQMPLDLLTGWLDDVARYNPMTYLLALARQGFLGEITWEVTSEGLLALIALLAVLVTFAHRGMRNIIP